MQRIQHRPMLDLQRKLRLVLERSRTSEGELRYATRAALAKALGMHPADLSKVMNGAPLPGTRIPALLRLFDLDVDLDVAVDADATATWIALACEPFDAFRARVRLAGGDDHCGGGGDTWDGFMGRLRRRRSTTPTDRAFSIVARDKTEWLRPRAAHASERMGPPRRTQDGEAQTPQAPPVVRAGQLARVFLDTQAALPRHNVGIRGAHVFMFQDVIVGSNRRIAALVPYPNGRGLEMPSGRIDPGEPQLQVPSPRGSGQFLEVYADWGPRRSLVAVVTDRPLDDEIVDESRRHDVMQIERVDLLAARLSDRDRWPEGSWTVWELPYRVAAA